MVQRTEDEHVSKNTQKVGTYRGGELFHTGDNSNGYFFLEENEDIVYFVRYRRIVGGQNTFGRQVLMAKKKDSRATTGVAMHVFYEYLLPKFKALISDTQQTQNGKSFWNYALDKAFETNKAVYFYDRRSTPNHLIELRNEDELLAVYDKIWGASEGHLRTHVVIAISPIKLRDR